MTTTLISGASRGLGLETARRLIEAGHTVYGGARDPGGADDLRALGASVVQLDVTDQASVDAAIAGLPELDVLVNNAGVTGPRREFDEVTPDDFTAVLDTNVLGVVRMTQAALPLLRRSSNPVIVNVASGVGWPRYLLDPDRVEWPVRSLTYPTSKAALIALTVLYSKNLPGMRVNAADPGLTRTDLNGRTRGYTVTEGTDATVAMATLDQSGPTGQFHDRTGVISY